MRARIDSEMPFQFEILARRDKEKAINVIEYQLLRGRGMRKSAANIFRESVEEQTTMRLLALGYSREVIRSGLYEKTGRVDLCVGLPKAGSRRKNRGNERGKIFRIICWKSVDRKVGGW
jgi:predicted metal-dependent RNase